MTLRRIIVAVLWSTIVGLLVAVAASSGDLISLRVWLITAAIGIIATALLQLIVVATPEPLRMDPLWRWRDRSDPSPPPRRPRELRSIEVLLVTAEGNARAHANQLRPRLTALARHHVPIRYGIDLDREPGRTAELLGSVAWLIDPTETDRTPTANDLERFLDLILVDNPIGASRP